MRHRIYVAVVSLVALVMCGWQVTYADEKPRPKEKASKEISFADREGAVLEFVATNHAELGELLKRLKSSNHKQYERAVRELATVSDKLSEWKGLDPTRYDIELRLWKVHSRIQLLAAKLTMHADEATEQELRKALEEQFTLRRELLMRERERVSQRLRKLETDLAQQEANREALLDKQYDAVLSGAKSQKLKLQKREIPLTNSKSSPSDSKSPPESTPAQP